MSECGTRLSQSHAKIESTGNDGGLSGHAGIMSTDPLDRLLATAARSAPTPSPDLDEAFEALAARIMSKPRHLRRRALAAAAVALSLAVTAPAAAAWISARTGWFGQAGMTENDTSEWLRRESPEMATIVASYGRDYPLPPGGSYDRVVAQLAAQPGLIQETGVQAAVAWAAMCQWERRWLVTSGADQDEAAAMLTMAAEWPILAATDGGGVVALRRTIAAAAASGDTAAVERDARLNCGLGR